MARLPRALPSRTSTSRSATDIAAVLYTRGTTGRPKGARDAHRA
ncbi:hypothetical protein [Streptomyces sp. NPDC051079]